MAQPHDQSIAETTVYTPYLLPQTQTQNQKQTNPATTVSSSVSSFPLIAPGPGATTRPQHVASSLTTTTNTARSVLVQRPPWSDLVASFVPQASTGRPLAYPLPDRAALANQVIQAATRATASAASEQSGPARNLVAAAAAGLNAQSVQVPSDLRTSLTSAVGPSLSTHLFGPSNWVGHFGMPTPGDLPGRPLSSSSVVIASSSYGDGAKATQWTVDGRTPSQQPPQQSNSAPSSSPLSTRSNSSSQAQASGSVKNENAGDGSCPRSSTTVTPAITMTDANSGSAPTETTRPALAGQPSEPDNFWSGLLLSPTTRIPGPYVSSFDALPTEPCTPGAMVDGRWYTSPPRPTTAVTGPSQAPASAPRRVMVTDRGSPLSVQVTRETIRGTKRQASTSLERFIPRRVGGRKIRVADTLPEPVDEQVVHNTGADADTSRASLAHSEQASTAGGKARSASRQPTDPNIGKPSGSIPPKETGKLLLMRFADCLRFQEGATINEWRTFVRRFFLTESRFELLIYPEDSRFQAYDLPESLLPIFFEGMNADAVSQTLALYDVHESPATKAGNTDINVSVRDWEWRWTASQGEELLWRASASLVLATDGPDLAKVKIAHFLLSVHESRCIGDIKLEPNGMRQGLSQKLRWAEEMEEMMPMMRLLENGTVLPKDMSASVIESANPSQNMNGGGPKTDLVLA